MSELECLVPVMILAAGSWPRFLIFLETHFLLLLLQENLSFAERQKNLFSALSAPPDASPISRVTTHSAAPGKTKEPFIPLPFHPNPSTSVFGSTSKKNPKSIKLFPPLPPFCKLPASLPRYFCYPSNLVPGFHSCLLQATLQTITLVIL